MQTSPVEKTILALVTVLAVVLGAALGALLWGGALWVAYSYALAPWVGWPVMPFKVAFLLGLVIWFVVSELRGWGQKK